MNNTTDEARTERRVMMIFQRHLDPASRAGLSPGCSLRADLNLDSITVVAILFDLERELRINIASSSLDLSTLETIRDVQVLAHELSRQESGSSR